MVTIVSRLSAEACSPSFGPSKQAILHPLMGDDLANEDQVASRDDDNKVKGIQALEDGVANVFRESPWTDLAATKSPAYSHCCARM